MELISTNGRIQIYMGLSTEDKPTGELATGSMVIELNTGKVKYYNETTETWSDFGGGSNG